MTVTDTPVTLPRLVIDGFDHLRAGRVDDAEQCFTRQIADAPDSPVGHEAMGHLLVVQNRHWDAAQSFLRAEVRAPLEAAYPWTAGRLLLAECHLPEDALGPLLRARVLLAVDDVRLLSDIAHCYEKIGTVDKAIPYLHDAIALNADDAGIVLELANALTQLGRFDEVETNVDRALTLGAKPGYPLYLLSATRRWDDSNEMLRRIGVALDTCDADDVDNARKLHWAAVRVHQDLGDPDATMHHAELAKRIPPGEAVFDRERQDAADRAMISVYSRGLLDAWRDDPATEAAPVFILGMPRTGTTLLESVLTGHAELHGIGERPYVGQIAGRLGLEHDNVAFISRVADMTVDHARHWVGDYERRAAFHRPGGCRTIDKTVVNFRYIGVILQLFPNAKILNCRRNPIDAGLSTYLNPIDHSIPWSRTWDDIAWQQHQHDTLMAHWQRIAPGRILEVHYTDTVADLEGQTRRILDFLDLDWDPNCLNHRTNSTNIQTVSLWQVRQDIYTTSIDRWRTYDKHLDGYIAALASYGISPAASVEATAASAGLEPAEATGDPGRHPRRRRHPT